MTSLKPLVKFVLRPLQTECGVGCASSEVQAQAVYELTVWLLRAVLSAFEKGRLFSFLAGLVSSLSIIKKVSVNS